MKKTTKGNAKKTKPKTAKKKAAKLIHRPRPSLEERLLAMDEGEGEYELPNMDEKLRQKLLKEEFRLRKKQPTAWTKTKYRKYALMNRPKKAKEKIDIQEEHEIRDN